MTIIGSCHCGNIKFQIEGDLPEELTECNCSFCAKRGALIAYFEPHQLQLTASPDDAIYRWNTKLVAHHFCANCGCATFSDSPAFTTDGSWDGTTRRLGVNTRLFDNFDAKSMPIIAIDGKHLW